MSLQLCDSNTGQPLSVKQLSVLAFCTGFLAETTITFVSENASSTKIQAELTCPLPEGATISGYSLEIDGIMMDAVIVEKDVARVVYEQEVRDNKEVSVVESVVGNVFRTKVGGMPPQSCKKMQIKYTQDLRMRDFSFIYEFTMGIASKIDVVNYEIILTDCTDLPTCSDQFKQLNFEPKGDGVFKASSVMRNVSLESSQNHLQFSWTASSPSRMVSVLPGEAFFAVHDLIPDLPMKDKHTTNFCIYWDCSYSRSEVALEPDFVIISTIIAAILERGSSLSITVRPFNYRLWSSKDFIISNKNFAELDEFLTYLSYLGATNFACLEEICELELPTCDFCLMFTDGMSTMGAKKSFRHSKPLYIINNASAGDFHFLRSLAKKSGGAYFSRNTAFSTIQKSILSERLQFRGASLYSGSQQIPVKFHPSVPTMVHFGEYFKIAGNISTSPGVIFHEGPAVLQITYGYGTADSPSYFSEIELDLVNINSNVQTLKKRHKMIGQFWAQKALAELAELTDDPNDAAYKKELLDLGRRFHVVTPNTSLVVLSSLDQYLKHEIPPPTSLTEMHSEYLSIMFNKKKEITDKSHAHFNHVMSWWLRRLAWYRDSTTHNSVYEREESRFVPYKTASDLSKMSINHHQLYCETDNLLTDFRFFPFAFSSYLSLP
eukprot:TRINITY_DN5588_c1_g2_i3.p1 TRINITY_DN5588_c1_g2~~TRINITY_DN5588_c1_g2_i3.p1  ORF type:complete len:662 (+),score=79.95 TRINITY_DN5588_c1_g2_i3:2-1987(+)